MIKGRTRERTVHAPRGVGTQYYPGSSQNYLTVLFRERPDRYIFERYVTVQYDNEFYTNNVQSEVMHDTHGNPHGFNAVRHFQQKIIDQGPRTYGFDASGDRFVLMRMGQPTRALPENFLVDPALLSDFAYATFHNAVRQIETEVSIGELLELPELKDFFVDIIHLRRKLRGLLRSLKALSGVFLGWSFGVNPLKDELMAYVNLLSKVDKRLEFLRRMQGKTYTVHYRWRIRDNSPSVDFGNWWMWDENDAVSGLSTACSLSRPIFGIHHMTSKLVIRNEITGLDDADARYRAIVAALGLNQPARILWNKIPLSFIVEWFVKLDNLFFDLANNPVASPFKGELRVVHSSFSVKSSVKSEYYVWRPPDVLPGYASLTVSGEIWNKSYIRKEGLPFGSYIRQGDDLSSFQQALLAALAIQRV